MTERVLLDANVLIALSFADHEHHSRVVDWFGTSRPFATTPSIQGSLVRFAVRVATIIHANDLLDELSANAMHKMWPDDQGYSSYLLRGVVGHRQVTDAYLAEIAASHQTTLGTMDTGLKTLRPSIVELIA
jgi:predicted nucleic acid-binding protein